MGGAPAHGGRSGLASWDGFGYKGCLRRAGAGPWNKQVSIDILAMEAVLEFEKPIAELESKIRELKDRYQNVCVQDHGSVYNTDLLEALELGCMLDIAETIVYAALERQESRGAHYRDDFQARDDKNWLAHSLVYRTDGGLSLKKKSVSITRFQPKERKY